jgi:transposase, IS30 family
MTDLNSTKFKHLTLDDRTEIQMCLDRGVTFKAIAARVGKDQTTISKEVKRHIQVNPASAKKFDRHGNPIADICPLLIKAPFVCNPCRKRRNQCGFQKQYYNAKAAQKDYETLLVEAREGIPLNKQEFYEIDAVITAGIRKGQHLYHIMATNNLGVSKSTVYRHLNRGYLSTSKIDFPRVVKFKPRQKHHDQYVPKAAKVGRTYEDFLAFIEEYTVTHWTEMDTVIGRVGGKVIITFDFTLCNFMFGLLLNEKSCLEVSEKITALKATLTGKGFVFGDIIPLALTDNGGEFSNVLAIENNAAGERETCLFFCDPYRACQKPKVEKNHTLFRDIVPKGSSFDHFTQDTVNLIFSHVNSVKRKSLGGKTPYEVFAFTYGAEIATLLGISPVPAGEVNQSPSLLKN